MMSGPNTFIYGALIAGLLFILYSLYSARSLPLLAELFSLMLSTAAAYSGLELCYLVLEGSKQLGDFKDQKLIIVLGSLVVFWVALLTVMNLVKGVAARGKLSGKQAAPVREHA